MRTSNSLKNSISSVLGNTFSCLIAFFAQAVFIKILGAEYLGLNGLFSNILTMLSVFELGVGNAIVFNLYKPIADNNINKINSLIKFYKKSYNFIIVFIIFFGLIPIPFLKYIVGDLSININIYIIYLLFLTSTVVSYFMAYKRSLIIAYQKNYIINIIRMFYLIILNILQLSIIYFTKNYYLYLVVKIICQLVENIFISLIANKQFPFVNYKDASSLKKETEKDIFNRVRALFFHKIGFIIINSTDNIIISLFLGVIQVGYYSNYFTIINAVNLISNQIITSSTASVGNLIVTENNTRIFEVFKRMRFLNFWISCFTAISIFIIINPFIKIWVGEKYLLSLFVVITLVFNYFQKSMRNIYNTFKDSSGTWIEDKYVPIVESILNIVFSILLLKIFGLAGVFIGTIISGLALWCYSYPKFVYKKLFNRSYYDYAKETIGYILLFIILASFTYFISTLFVFDNIFLQLIINAVIAVIIPNAVMILIFKKSEEFKYFVNIIKNIFNKILKKKVTNA